MENPEPNDVQKIIIEYGRQKRGRSLKDQLALGLSGMLFGIGFLAFLFWWVLFRK